VNEGHVPRNPAGEVEPPGNLLTGPSLALAPVLRFATAVGLPITLAYIGLTGLSEEILRQVAARATGSGETIRNEPFAVRADMVANAILAADALGTARKSTTQQ
jgi:glycerol dehydrogenase